MERALEHIRLRNGDTVERRVSDVIVRFAGARRVLGTSRLNGGYRTDLDAVFNHCDQPPGQSRSVMRAATYREHLALAAQEAGLDPARASGLSTALDMKYMQIAQRNRRGVTVTAVVTGGILHNGRRAGDRATMWEENEKFYLAQENSAETFPLLSRPKPRTCCAAAGEHDSGGSLGFAKQICMPKLQVAGHGVNSNTLPGSGTVNIILHITADMTENAMLTAVMVAAEAKAAAIEEEKIQSCYGEGLATGSGTDGVIVIADAASPVLFTQVGTDTIAGECIGQAVKEAVRNSLILNCKVDGLKEKM